ncbi:MAG: ABC transporter ATP-binding protein [Clostridiaceae bacterium]|nr:ABC transporter ATP-binding protein [Clostridiaceae bacterium]
MLKNLKRQFQWLIDRYSKEYLIASVMITLSYGIAVAPPWFAGFIADRIIADELTITSLLVYVAMLLVLTALYYVTGFMWSYYLIKAFDVSELVARQKTIKKILNQNAPFFLTHSTGSLMGKSTNDVSSIGEMASFGIMLFFDATLYQISIIFIMAISGSWLLTLLTVLPYPFLILSSKLIGKKLYHEYDLAQQAFDEMNDRVLENVQGVRVVRAFVLEEQEMEAFEGRAEQLYRQNLKVARLDALFVPASRFVQGTSFIIAMIVGANLVKTGAITIGQLMTHVFYLGMLSWPMIAMGEFINTSQSGSASMERIQEIWDWREEISDPPDAIICEEIGDITFDHFSFSWPGEKEPILKDISFTVKQGMTLGVVGRVGSGKTALLKQILRFYPQEGDLTSTVQDCALPAPPERLRLNDLPIRLYDRRSVRRRIGYVPQESTLFSLTVLENILLGADLNREGWPLSVEELTSEQAFWKKSYRDIVKTVEDRKNKKVAPLPVPQETLERAIAIADFAKDIEFLPEGLDTLTGEQGIALSGGQKQRISIARALLANPEVLILDDCLSAVDAITEKNVLAALARERAGKTTLVSSHRLSAIRDADLIIVLEDGCIAARGTHEELMEAGGWYREQYEKQQLEETTLWRKEVRS